MFIDKMLEWAFCRAMNRLGAARFATAIACFFMVIFPIAFCFFFLTAALITGLVDVERALILSLGHSLGAAVGASIGAAIVICKNK